MIYFCCDDNRRSLVRKDLNNTGLNGIDYLEVCGAKTTTEDLRQRVLKVFFVRMVEDPLLTRLQAAPSSVAIEIEGGERITNVQVINASFEQRSNGDEEYFEITVDKRGDFSAYTLKLLESNSAEHLKGLDPELAEVDFSFKVECAGDFDCREVSACPPKVRDEPELDYLNKDYSSFRQLILDRMALIAPGWRERNPADLGMTLVEMLAYVGDHLSYRQDAIATEAYLGTARQRVSIRRHARLLDYPMHEGCNSRAWVQVRPNANAPTDGIVLPRNSALLESDPAKVTNTCFSTDAGVDCVLADDVDKLKQILDARAPEVFEPMHDVFLHPAHTEMSFLHVGRAAVLSAEGSGEGRACRPFHKNAAEPRTDLYRETWSQNR